MTTSYGHRLKKARELAKISQGALARKVGIKQPTISNLESIGKGSTYTPTFAKILNVNPTWLAEGLGEMKPTKFPERKQSYGIGVECKELDIEEKFVFIKTSKIELPINENSYSTIKVLDQPNLLSKAFVDKNNYLPHQLLGLAITDDSMAPSLYPDDVVVVNTAENKPEEAHVFAINFEGQLLFRRTIREGGDWWLVSDNPNQKKYPRKRASSKNCLLLGKLIHRQTTFI